MTLWFTESVANFYTDFIGKTEKHRIFTFLPVVHTAHPVQVNEVKAHISAGKLGNIGTLKEYCSGHSFLK